MISTSVSLPRRSFSGTFAKRTALGLGVTVLAVVPEVARAQSLATTPADVAAPELASLPSSSPPDAPLPRSLPYEEGPPPPGYVVQHRLWHPMWIAGAGIMLGSWLLPAGLAAGYDNYDYFVPVVGPLLGPWSNEKDVASMRVALTALHITGIAMILAGVSTDNPRFVRADLAGLRVSPVLTGREVGAQVSGSF